MKGFLISGILCILLCCSCSPTTDDITDKMGGHSWYSGKDGFSTGITYHRDQTSRIRVVLITNITERPLRSIRSTLVKEPDGTFVYQINSNEITVGGDFTLIALGNDLVPRVISISRSNASRLLSKLKKGIYTRNDIVSFWRKFIDPNGK